MKYLLYIKANPEYGSYIKPALIDNVANDDSCAVSGSRIIIVLRPFVKL